MDPSDPYNSYSFGYIIHSYLLPSTKVNANNPAIKKSRKAVALIILEWQIHKPEEGYRSRRGVRCNQIPKVLLKNIERIRLNERHLFMGRLEELEQPSVKLEGSVIYILKQVAVL